MRSYALIHFPLSRTPITDMSSYLSLAHAIPMLKSPFMNSRLGLLTAVFLCAPPLFSQGGGGVQFRDYKAPTPASKPRTACAGLVSLTGYEFSVYSAAVIPASEAAPEHCRVNLLVQPDVNVEVNLPALWNGRLYMFGNGGYAGESFETAGRAAHRARGLRAGFVTAATDTGHSAQREPGEQRAPSFRRTPRRNRRCQTCRGGRSTAPGD